MNAMRLRNLKPARLEDIGVLFSRKKRQNREGATSVEFALVAPVFFLLVFICVEFIRLNMIRNLTQDASYYAARTAMVPGATVEEARAEAERVLGFMFTQGAEIIINDGGALDREAREVTVEIRVPMKENSFLVPKFTSQVEFNSKATIRTERYDGFFDPDL